MNADGLVVVEDEHEAVISVQSIGLEIEAEVLMDVVVLVLVDA